MTNVFVGAQKLELRVLECRSLKEKRMILRRIKDRVRERVGLPICEVGALDMWQRAEVAVACTSKDRAQVLALLDEVRRCVLGVEGVELLRDQRDVTTFAGQDQGLELEPATTDWVPEEWRDLMSEEGPVAPTPAKEAP